VSGIYYNPEEYGVRLVGSVDLGSYDWCGLYVFQREADGALLWGTDSGCSCYGPFDNEGAEALESVPVGYGTKWRAWYRDNARSYGEFDSERDALEKLIGKVGQILSEQRRVQLRKVGHDG